MINIVDPESEFDFLGSRGTLGVISLAVIGICIAGVLTIGPAWGIDFKGGTELIVRFAETLDTAQVRQKFDEAGIPAEQVQQYGSPDDGEYLIQMQKVSVVGPKLKSQAGPNDIAAEAVVEQLKSVQKLRNEDNWNWNSENPDRLDFTVPQGTEIDRDAIIEKVEGLGLQDVGLNDRGSGRYALEFSGLKPKIDRELKKVLPDAYKPDRDGMGIKRIETVGPRAGEQLRNSGILSVVVALFCILVYVAFRFDLRYAPGAVAALVHDVVIAVGFFTFTQLEISLPIIAALLTIVGYSLNDTIVNFDRIRENLETAGTEALDKLSNRSINEMLSRTINTSLTTLLAVVSIAVLGGGLIQNFAIALIVGVIVGTYSSVYVATPVMLKMDEYLQQWRESREAANEPKV